MSCKSCQLGRRYPEMRHFRSPDHLDGPQRTVSERFEAVALMAHSTDDVRQRVVVSLSALEAYLQSLEVFDEVERAEALNYVWSASEQPRKALRIGYGRFSWRAKTLRHLLIARDASIRALSPLQTEGQA